MHHTSHILPQGRTVWHNTNKKPEDGEDEEEDQEDLMDEIEPEQGENFILTIFLPIRSLSLDVNIRGRRG